MIYVKKYVALWIVAGFLSCCAQLTLFAMSPAVIAAKQREFRKHIATFKKLNASGKGMDPQAAEASEKAKKVINEVRPYTDVKWMEILLETEIKEKEEKFHEDADSALWHIGGILGQLENKHNPYFTVGKRETLGTKFFKELHTKITNDARELLTKKYGISEVKKENYLTGTGKSYPGGLFYLLDEQHNKFIDFANIFGHTNKSFYKQTDTQISVFDSIKRDLSYIIFNIYYSPTENNTNHFTIDKNSGLLLTPKQVKDVISDYNNLQKSGFGGIFYHLYKDLAHYKNLMEFVGQKNKLLNISTAIEQINNDVKTLNNNNALNISMPFDDDKLNRKYTTTEGKQIPYTFNDIITEVYNKSLTKVGDTIKAAATTGEIDRGNNPEKFGENIVKAVLQPIKDIIVTLLKNNDESYFSKETGGNQTKRFTDSWIKKDEKDRTDEELKKILYSSRSQTALETALANFTKTIDKIDMLKFTEKDFEDKK